MIRRVTAAALVLVIAAAVYSLFAPYQGFPDQVFVEIPKGSGTRQIASLLASNGVIRHPLQLLLVRAMRPHTTLKAGDYMFEKAASPWDIYGRIVRGDIFYHVLAVPEGQNTYDIAASLEHLGIMPAGDFLKAAHDPALIRDLDPKAPTLEGYLFPDTYHVTRHMTPAQLCKQMTDRFRKAWQGTGATGRIHDAVTMASLVEKEAKVPAERPLIASVFFNRLRIGMPLQCDPTTIYAALIEKRYRGTIYRSDLESRQSYNTYQHPGLPPGPIANPGIAAIRAALEPASSEYLYFVARPDASGAHQFSTALAQHAHAVQEYRRGLRKTEQASSAAGPHRGTRN